MPTSREPWFPLSSPESASEEATQLEQLVAAVGTQVERGAPRVWVSVAPGRAAASDSLRLAVSVALHCPDVRVVAAAIRVPSWIRLAEDAATADGLCGGRLELAFSELPDEGSLARLRDGWSGAPVSFGSDERIELHPRPVRRDGPALWAEVVDVAEAARAAQRGLGAIAQDTACARAHAAASPGGTPLPLALVGSALNDSFGDGAIALTRLELPG